MTNSNDFSETINKYRILDNQSNKLSKIFFDKIVSDVKINLETKNYVKYGYIFVSVKNPNNIKIYYNDFLIAKINSSSDIVIPCAFEENSYLQIMGTSDEFNIVLYGANIINENKIRIYPTKNYIAKNRGKIVVLSYASKEDILDNNLTEVLNIENCIDFQCVKLSQNEYCAYLIIENDTLYLYTEIDNYTNKIEIASGVKTAKILSDSWHSKFAVVYIKDNYVYFKTLSEDLTLSSEGSISFSNNYVPKSFSQIEILNYNGPSILGVNLFGDSMEIFYFNGLNFIPILTKSCQSSKIFINQNNIEIFAISDYKVSISKYTFDIGTITLGQSGASYNIWNASDIIKVENVYLVYNDGVCSEVNYDSE